MSTAIKLNINMLAGYLMASPTDWPNAALRYKGLEAIMPANEIVAMVTEHLQKSGYDATEIELAIDTLHRVIAEEFPEKVTEIKPADKVPASTKYNHTQSLTDALRSLEAEIEATVRRANEEVRASLESINATLMTANANGLSTFEQWGSVGRELIANLRGEAYGNSAIGTTTDSSEARALNALLKNANPMHVGKTIRMLMTIDTKAAYCILDTLKALNKIEEYTRHLPPEVMSKLSKPKW